MKYVIVFRPEVREDLNTAYDWYEAQKLGLGDDFIASVNELLSRVCLMPESYALVYQDVRRAVIKRFPYAVYYRVISSRVVVTAIFHSRRNPKRWRSRT
ncbi:MAG: type II toxin-antitoxin system RelE/ParE family toxin [Synechocystis sp.]|nr:type II toxin-antitoxin system RelE/ParE family toxin [Synechocystis sp.]